MTDETDLADPRGVRAFGPPLVVDYRDLHLKLGCDGWYGYANGYGLVDGYAYCDQACPIKGECWRKLMERVQNEHPIEVEDFHVIVHNAAQKWRVPLEVAGERVRSERLKFGAPGPYDKEIIHQVDQGMERRKRDDPSVLERLIGTPMPRLTPGVLIDRSHRS